jgi:hypothetical protein
VTFIEKTKIAQAFTHLPLAFLGQGVDGDYPSYDGTDEDDFFDRQNCWDSNGGAAAWGDGPDLEPEPAQAGNGQITHDKAMASTFLTQLDPTATRFTFQTFDDDKNRQNKALTKVLHGTLDARFAELTRLNNLGAGVFITTSETNFLGRSAKNIVRPRALFYDADGAEQVTRARAITTECDALPSMKVESGGGEHGYYLCDDIPLDQFSALQKSLAAKLGTDPAVHDLPRVMRLPGTLHLKNPADPRLVKLVATDGAVRRWKLADLIAKLGLSVTAPNRTNGRGASNRHKIEVAEAFRHLNPNQSLGEGIDYPTADIEEIRSAALAIPPSVITDEPNWMSLARALAWQAKQRPDDTEALWEILDTVSRQAPKYDKDDNRAKFDRYIDEAGTGEKTTTINTLFFLAREHGWQGGSSPASEQEPPTTITWDPAELRVSFSNVPHRPWLYGPYLIRGEITIIAAPGGVGKTALTTGIATAIATGTVLMDDKIWETDLKVLSINGEDGKAEVTRRMWAFARAHAHQIAVEAPERFYTIGADDERTQQISFLQTNERNIPSLNLNGFAVLDSALAALRPDLVMLDPFVVFCSGGNMNDNAVMARVMQGLKIIAVKYNCAILVVHHNKKGGERDNQESIGGAAAIVNLPRCALMPVPMTREEAIEFKVLPSERFSYFKLVNAKPNFTPKSEDSPWYQLHSIEIPNADHIYEYGDRVQAVTRVTLPLPQTASDAASDPKIQRAILDLVDHGKLIDGIRYPYSPNVTGAKNQRALLDDALAAVTTAMAPRQWKGGDLRAVVHAAIDKMKVEGWLYEDKIKRGKFRQALALYVEWSRTPWPNPASQASNSTAADEEEPADGDEISEE